MKELEDALERADDVMVVGTKAGSNEDVLVTIIKHLVQRHGSSIDIPATEYEKVANAPLALSISTTKRDENDEGVLNVAVSALTDADRALKKYLERTQNETPVSKPNSFV